LSGWHARVPTVCVATINASTAADQVHMAAIMPRRLRLRAAGAGTSGDALRFYTSKVYMSMREA
jgi:hypothetical protein